MIFTVLAGSGIAATTRPEPADWFAGDMHVHRSCGEAPVSVASIRDVMIARDISVVSLLADMGNGEVQDAVADLPKVNGLDDTNSTPDRIIHWDGEWHWDATYTQYPHQALGGHIVALGLTNAQQLWSEYTHPIFDWAHQRSGVAGFAHLQYLPANSFPQTLNCCLPIEYPVEVALGSCDFISEDVAGGDSAMLAYYRLLNCGFRPGFAGGSDYPCDASISAVMTFVQVTNGLTYRKWVDGIAAGRTVVSRNGRSEFLDLKVNTNSIPGDEIHLPAGGGAVRVDVQWSAISNVTGTVEIVLNGIVVTNKTDSVNSNNPSSLGATVTLTNSGWLCARRMGGGEHRIHTAAVFVTVDNAPVRASVADAQFYVAWMDELLARTSPGGVWNFYFPTDLAPAQARYQAARAVYQQIANEASALVPPAILTTNLPDAAVNVFYSATLAEIGGTAPCVWSLASGQLPPGLTLDANTGAITGIPEAAGTLGFTAQVSDSSIPVRTDTKPLNLLVAVSGNSLGVIGNTNDGSTNDAIWQVTPYINACRFQAASNMTVALMRAQVQGISGSYKCAIYAESSGEPGQLLRSTLPFTGPGTGWQTFALTAPLELANGGGYWLAIWSDDANARVYYNDTIAPLRWAQYGYGTWPDPLVTTGAGNATYCIYATGGSAPVFVGTPTNRTLAELTALNVTNAASDADAPLQTLAYSLLSAPTNAAISTNGVIIWTPDETQAPSTNLFTTVVRDGVAAATNSFTVIVSAPLFQPAIISIDVASGVATVTWSAVPGQSYALEYSDGASGTNWTALLPGVVADSSTVTATNQTGGVPMRVYRVRSP